MFELASRLVGVYKVNHMVWFSTRNLGGKLLTCYRPKVSQWRTEITLLGEHDDFIRPLRRSTGVWCRDRESAWGSRSLDILNAICAVRTGS